MIIERKYKFYAAHRNQLLKGTKCERLHGHRYGLDIGFGVSRNARDSTKGSVTTLFEDLDSRTEKLISRLDHRTFYDKFDQQVVKSLSMMGDPADIHVCLPYPSSVENVCHYIFGCLVTEHFEPSPHLWVDYIRLQETDSAIIIYTKTDWVNDHQLPFTGFEL